MELTRRQLLQFAAIGGGGVWVASGLGPYRAVVDALAPAQVRATGFVVDDFATLAGHDIPTTEIRTIFAGSDPIAGPQRTGVPARREIRVEPTGGPPAGFEMLVGRQTPFDGNRDAAQLTGPAAGFAGTITFAYDFAEPIDLAPYGEYWLVFEDALPAGDQPMSVRLELHHDGTTTTIEGVHDQSSNEVHLALPERVVDRMELVLVDPPSPLELRFHILVLRTLEAIAAVDAFREPEPAASIPPFPFLDALPVGPLALPRRTASDIRTPLHATGSALLLPRPTDTLGNDFPTVELAYDVTEPLPDAFALVLDYRAEYPCFARPFVDTPAGRRHGTATGYLPLGTHTIELDTIASAGATAFGIEVSLSPDATGSDLGDVALRELRLEPRAGFGTIVLDDFGDFAGYDIPTTTRTSGTANDRVIAVRTSEPAVDVRLGSDGLRLVGPPSGLTGTVVLTYFERTARSSSDSYRLTFESALATPLHVRCRTLRENDEPAGPESWAILPPGATEVLVAAPSGGSDPIEFVVDDPAEPFVLAEIEQVTATGTATSFDAFDAPAPAARVPAGPFLLDAGVGASSIRRSVGSSVTRPVRCTDSGLVVEQPDSGLMPDPELASLVLAYDGLGSTARPPDLFRLVADVDTEFETFAVLGWFDPSIPPAGTPVTLGENTLSFGPFEREVASHSFFLDVQVPVAETAGATLTLKQLRIEPA